MAAGSCSRSNIWRDTCLLNFGVFGILVNYTIDFGECDASVSSAELLSQTCSTTNEMARDLSDFAVGRPETLLNPRFAEYRQIGRLRKRQCDSHNRRFAPTEIV